MVYCGGDRRARTRPRRAARRPIEANLLDYDGGALYDRHMRLLLCSFVRSEKKFDSLEQLRAEVMKNREQVRAYFERDF